MGEIHVEEPDGCLGCNYEEIAKVLRDNNVPESRFVEVPRPRHNWSDVICCDECGKAWLVMTEEVMEDEG